MATFNFHDTELGFEHESPELLAMNEFIKNDDPTPISELGRAGRFITRHGHDLVADQKYNVFWIIENSVKHNAVKCLGAFVPYLGKPDISMIIRCAIQQPERNHIVRQTLPFYSSECDDSHRLFDAIVANNMEAFDLLLPLSLPALAADRIAESGGDRLNVFGPLILKAAQDRESNGTWQNTPENQLMEAAISGDIEKMDRLISCGVDPKTAHSAALRKAAKHGHADCVNLLRYISDPTFICRESSPIDALIKTIAGNSSSLGDFPQKRDECFKLLIGFMSEENKDNSTYHLLCASIYQRFHESTFIVDSLIPLSNIKKIEKRLMAGNIDDIQQLRCIHEAVHRTKALKEAALLRSKREGAENENPRRHMQKSL